jgi:hypothetical protein
MMNRVSEGLLERLEQGPVICAEGYLFELERRGYLQAGAFVPEVVLDHPEVVTQLHRDFVHAGSDVVEAFTYYAHREKMRIVGKERSSRATSATRTCSRRTPSRASPCGRCSRSRSDGQPTQESTTSSRRPSRTSERP